MTSFALSESQFSPVSGQIPKRRYHEGRKGTLVRPDGSTDGMELQRFSSETTFNFDDIEDLSLKKSYELMQEAMADLGRQRDSFVIKTINDAVTAIGNVVNGGGRTMDPELIMEALDKLQIDFNYKDEPIWPMFVLAPNTEKRFEAVLAELEKEPYKEDMTALIQRKRREWHARESRRKLVD